MELTIRQKAGLAIGYTLLVFAIGRYTKSPAKVSTQIVEQQKEKETEAKNIQTHKTVTETKHPDGTDTIVTQIDQTTTDAKTEQIDTTIKATTSVTPVKTLNISVLGANDFHESVFKPTYGLSVTKPLIGPLTIGAFGLMNGVVGVSIGLDF